MNQPSEIWRSLDDLEGTPEFREFAAKEFPGFTNVYESLGEAEVIDAPGDGLNRRQFLELSAAALGMAGLTGCRRPDLKILPYSQTPESVSPGVPTFYATSMPMPGGCFPILVESHEGRPTKIEGNPKHPASLGGTDARTQASILDLYSPDRSKQVLKRDADGKLAPKSWEEFDAFAAEHFANLRKTDGDELRFLVEDNPSPALRFLREQMKEKYPKAVWHRYEPLDRDNCLEGTKLAFGQPLQVSYNLAKAYRIVSLDCDFLGLDGNEVANGRGFAERRRDPQVRRAMAGHANGEKKKENHAELARDRTAQTNRLYVLENTYTVTGTMADHRLRIPAAHVADYALALCKEISAVKGVSVPPAIKEALEKARASELAIPEKWIKEVAADLVAFNGKGLVIAGSRQPALVHALCAFINEALGNAGITVEYRPIVAEEYQSIADLAASASKV
jgi:molybdopterin-containing oxidoreductase family iron-sulfur binding subunit